GVSKAYAMTGWRIGYAAAPKAIAQAMGDFQGQSTSNPCAVSQAAAAAALGLDDSVIAPMLVEYARRRGVVIERLARLPGLRLSPPAGTFYAFPNVEGWLRARGLKSADELADQLLSKAHIATVPGSGFGVEGYLRLSFATAAESLLQALDRLVAYSGS
ncbi:MAG TPA: aminotransferase class I/II-fold pyridoxal phosphate-dependent enzyme, partial [Candidatus Udaeobacter sp.]|nr:aminotransferase class I/II-fold pyridoxal phosphate-dependent enzyme [Candidatus Udaeobacter sp.]